MKLVYLALCIVVAGDVSAYPVGAGGCDGGRAAVGGFHLDKSTSPNHYKFNWKNGWKGG